ncbi:MAG: hypothetical protein H7641_08720 [Candidatus Heimdallarchaeota archaeon]|nr:hypothetical protein [Candidatus Heimdallarchaeota archaeon]MCK4877648.1 hypothetical protein [Candidatus Heimdallarchaeota archaeon]
MTELRKLAQRSLWSFYKWKIQIPITIVIFLGLFILAIYLKHILGDWINSEVGTAFYHTFQNNEGVSVTWYFENYTDAEYYYESYLENFRYNGWNPYAPPLPFDSENKLDFYLYGPFLIYGFAFISLFVELFNPGTSLDFLIPTSIKWTAIVFDALSVAMIYLIIISLKTFKSKRVVANLAGISGALAYIFMPMNLLYIDASYLNIPQMTFFTLLALYLFLKEKYVFSSIVFSIAWLSKQMPLFSIIPLFFILGKKTHFSFALKRFLIPFILSTFIFSIPWIFLNPFKYSIRIIGAGRSLWYATLAEEGNKHGVTLAHSLLYGNAEFLSKVYVYLNVAMIPFLIFYIYSIFIAHFNGRNIAEDETNFYIYNTWLIVLTHTFLSRGVYKYYDAFFNPFLVISSILLINKLVNRVKSNSEHEKNVRKKNILLILSRIIFPVIFIVSIALIYSVNWGIMISSRFLHPVWLLLLFLFLSVLLPIQYYRELKMRKNYKYFWRDIKLIFAMIWFKVKNTTIMIWKKISFRKENKEE